ncbi:4'-phosphopantetheinyl transferase superfamily protein [Fulvivirgaceae bacterium PWU4]|uniref:4'-phosphopantetheinyl transferase superfamily protein n=1 Tax=Chryseosolibacter histidini TaxID=2782349 RepID=A0AAP2DF28_9BACT|nr:4'-phosphopantetheinyl transferase superfamily protein [Chryseosolibacter histidini]MBT1695328.1 4'-phosphopantetheinyl transferase superfamily protein [Chryseosolibacter histidini]
MLIAYAENSAPFPPNVWDGYLCRLPNEHREQVLRYKFREDAQACLYGKLLLLRCLEELGIGHLRLEDLRYTSHQRPYFNDAAIDFNISHSGKFVVCAAANNIRLGIDIEQIKPVAVTDFKEQFSDDEMRLIQSDDGSFVNFYNLWTKKEALIKADGKGLSIPLKQVSVIGAGGVVGVVGEEHQQRRHQQPVIIENRSWFLTEINISEGYCCHLATSEMITEGLRVRRFMF